MRKLLRGVCLILVAFAGTASAQDDMLLKGVGLYQEGKFAEAVSVLKEFVKIDSTHWAAWTYLGGSLANLGRTDEAIAAMKTKAGVSRTFDKDRDKDVRIKSKAKAIYTKKARRKNIEGGVIVAVELRSDGKIGFVLPLQTLPEGLTESAIEAAHNITFEPAIKNGAAVSVIRKFHYEFTTQNEDQ